MFLIFQWPSHRLRCSGWMKVKDWSLCASFLMATSNRRAMPANWRCPWMAWSCQTAWHRAGLSLPASRPGLTEVVLNVTQTSIRPADAGTYSCKYDSSSVTTTNVVMVLSGQICMIHYQLGFSNFSLWICLLFLSNGIFPHFEEGGRILLCLESA